MRANPARRRRRLPTPRLGATAAAVAAVVALAGCQSLGDDTGDGGGSGGDDVVQPGGDDGGRDGAPLLQIEQAGGFVMPGYDFSSVPELTVYADGRAIVHGPQIEIFPPPALPNLLVVELDDAAVDAIVDAARDAGLLGEEPEYGQPPIADAPTTTVTLTVDGQTYTHAANALGFAEGMGEDGLVEDGLGEDGDDGPADDGSTDDGLTDEERAARIALAEFVSDAHELVGTAGNETPYEIDAFAYVARPAAEPGEYADEIEPQVLDWPLDLALADLDGCTVAEGDDAATLLEVLAGANTMTQFEQDGVAYEVWFRPLLPHESGCDDIE